MGTCCRRSKARFQCRKTGEQDGITGMRAGSLRNNRAREEARQTIQPQTLLRASLRLAITSATVRVRLLAGAAAEPSAQQSAGPGLEIGCKTQGLLAAEQLPSGNHALRAPPSGAAWRINNGSAQCSVPLAAAGAVSAAAAGAGAGAAAAPAAGAVAAPSTPAPRPRPPRPPRPRPLPRPRPRPPRPPPSYCSAAAASAAGSPVRGGPRPCPPRPRPLRDRWAGSRRRGGTWSTSMAALGAHVNGPCHGSWRHTSCRRRADERQAQPGRFSAGAHLPRPPRPPRRPPSSSSTSASPARCSSSCRVAGTTVGHPMQGSPPRRAASVPQDPARSTSCPSLSKPAAAHAAHLQRLDLALRQRRLVAGQGRVEWLLGTGRGAGQGWVPGQGHMCQHAW